MVRHHFFPDAGAALDALGNTVERWHNSAGGRIRCWVNIEGKEPCSVELHVGARRLAEKLGKHETVSLLREQEAVLERSRLVREETLCHDSLTQSERRWLQSNRSDEAKHWNLLTDLSPEHLSHGL